MWTLDPKNDSVFDVLVRLKDFGDKLFQDTGVVFHVNGLDHDLHNIHLSLDWRRHLTMMFKEAMTNVLKHAQCNAVELRVQRQGESLEVALVDNGRGFDAEGGGRSTGQGLQNMRSRAKKLGGTVAIDSMEGRGTRLSFVGNIPGEET